MTIDRTGFSGVAQTQLPTRPARPAPHAESAVEFNASALHELTKQTADAVQKLRADIAQIKELIVAMNANALGPAAVANGAEEPVWTHGMPVSGEEDSARLKTAFAKNGGMSGSGLPSAHQELWSTATAP